MLSGLSRLGNLENEEETCEEVDHSGVRECGKSKEINMHANLWELCMARVRPYIQVNARVPCVYEDAWDSMRARWRRPEVPQDV